MTTTESPTVPLTSDVPPYRLHVTGGPKGFWAYILLHEDESHPVWANYCTTSRDVPPNEMFKEALSSGLVALRGFYS